MLPINMCLNFWRCCCGSKPSSSDSSQEQCQDMEMKDLTPELMITITTQPQNSSLNNLSFYAPLNIVERPNIANGSDEIEHYNVDDYEARTPTMWRAWWLQGAGDQLSSIIL